MGPWQCFTEKSSMRKLSASSRSFSNSNYSFSGKSASATANQLIALNMTKLFRQNEEFAFVEVPYPLCCLFSKIELSEIFHLISVLRQNSIMDGKKYYKKLEAFNLFLYRTFRIQYEHTHT